MIYKLYKLFIGPVRLKKVGILATNNQQNEMN
jgi:hypothetical protein